MIRDMHCKKEAGKTLRGGPEGTVPHGSLPGWNVRARPAGSPAGNLYPCPLGYVSALRGVGVGVGSSH
eukprot:717993-Hanusia_phi.AAC.7